MGCGCSILISWVVTLVVHGAAWALDEDIVFVEHSASPDVRCGPNLWIIRFDGSALHQLTDDQSMECAPAWSPDGSRIAFIRCASKSIDCDLWLIDPDGTDQDRLDIDLPSEPIDLNWL